MAANVSYCAWEESVDPCVEAIRYYECDPEAPLSNECIKMLQTDLEKLHDQRVVHGDICVPNTFGYAKDWSSW